MLHVLVGALVGATVGAASQAIVSAAMGQPITLKGVLAAAAGGAMGGAITTATLGAGGVAAASGSRALTAFVAGGASGGATNRLVNNFFDEVPLLDGVPESALVGAASGAVARGVSKALEPLTKRALGLLPGADGGSTLRAVRTELSDLDPLEHFPEIATVAGRAGLLTFTQASAGALTGGASATVARVAKNGIEGQPLGKDLADAAVTGFSLGAVGFGVRRVTEPVVQRVVPVNVDPKDQGDGSSGNGGGGDGGSQPGSSQGMTGSLDQVGGGP